MLGKNITLGECCGHKNCEKSLVVGSRLLYAVMIPNDGAVFQPVTAREPIMTSFEPIPMQ